MYCCLLKNLQAPNKPSGWRDAYNSNQNYGVSLGGPYSNFASASGSTVPAHPAYMHRSLKNSHAASVTTFNIRGILILCGDAPQVVTLSSIRGSIVVVMIGRVRLLHNFCCKSPCLVSVTFPFFPSLVSFESFSFADSDS